MITGLLRFAESARRAGGDVGASEVVDAARALTMVDVSERTEVEQAVRLCLSWAATDPCAFGELFDAWFSGEELDLADAVAVTDDAAAAHLDAETVPAAGIHDEEGVLSQSTDDPADGATSDDGSAADAAPGVPSSNGSPVGGRGDAADTAPLDAPADSAPGRDAAVVELPIAPGDAALELARGSLAAAVDRRAGGPVVSLARSVEAVSEPLRPSERRQLDRVARDVDRYLSGAPSWRRRPAPSGAIDLRRTMRASVTARGLPLQLERRGPRTDAGRLVVLVDLSLSVRGTSRLVLHLVHRLRSAVGVVRAFGFVDAFVPIDRALRTADPQRAIADTLALVDVDAASDPGRAFRSWCSRWQHLVTPDTHVLILSDGRCNGHDPGFGTIAQIRRRSASTTWISPEPEGAWCLGRGEMEGYAAVVDRAITVRQLDDLAQLATPLGGSRRSHRASSSPPPVAASRPPTPGRRRTR